MRRGGGEGKNTAVVVAHAEELDEELNEVWTTFIVMSAF